MLLQVCGRLLHVCRRLPWNVLTICKLAEGSCKSAEGFCTSAEGFPEMFWPSASLQNALASLRKASARLQKASPKCFDHLQACRRLLQVCGRLLHVCRRLPRNVLAINKLAEGSCKSAEGFFISSMYYVLQIRWNPWLEILYIISRSDILICDNIFLSNAMRWNFVFIQILHFQVSEK